MPNYKVHFSFYSEENGFFDEAALEVDASNQFEAREKAWLLSETNDNLKFASNIQLCGITWDSSPLNMQDYFNAEVSYVKYQLKQIEQIDMPNYKLEKNDDSYKRKDNEKYGLYGELSMVSHIAEGLGKGLGMIPPAIFEELHYAKKIVDLLDQQGQYDNAQTLYEKIERAEKWDRDAVFDITVMHREKSLTLNGNYIDLHEQFGKNGVYPETADLDDRAYQYISRWHRASKTDELMDLSKLGNKDVIANSQDMNYSDRYVLVDANALSDEHKKPENMVWYVTQEHDGNAYSQEAKGIHAINPITDESKLWQKEDLQGVLRPEVVSNIDFDKIKEEHQQQEANEHDEEIEM